MYINKNRYLNHNKNNMTNKKYTKEAQLLEEIKQLPGSEMEQVKENSNYLRGTILDGLNDPITGALSPDDQLLIKFHGTYQQQNRDLDVIRRKQKLEPLYSFLIRIRVPGGVVTPKQWIEVDNLADQYADGDLKLTTRQAFQFHGVLKRNLKQTIKSINSTLLDTLAACGDVSRNVMCSANSFESNVHKEVADGAAQISAALTPQTGAYHEIWLDDKLVEDSKKEIEPLYKQHYLPRKFKIAMAIPPRNDSDVLSNDLGFIAIVKNDELIGYNLAVGGGMAYTFGNTKTYPRVADIIGYFPKADLVKVAEAVLVFQRDHGNRSNRKNARLKYTIDRFGLDYLKDELKRTHQINLEAPKDFKFTTLGDKIGWSKGTDGKWHYTLFVEGGKLTDKKTVKAKTAIKEVAKIHKGQFILTGNQNLVIANVSATQKKKIDQILNSYLNENTKTVSQMRLNSIACAALPLCSLAFAEAERYLPSMVDKIELLLEKYNLTETPISIRMTGCPNGCGRPFLAEIGLVGRSPGKYNLYLGADFTGKRLNKLYREMLTEADILNELDPLLKDYSENRQDNEHFGDFLIRKDYIKATLHGTQFHN